MQPGLLIWIQDCSFFSFIDLLSCLFTIIIVIKLLLFVLFLILYDLFFSSIEIIVVSSRQSNTEEHEKHF